jgi:nucleoside-diphosphate-sugar epimerase
MSTAAFIYKLLFYNGAPLEPWTAGTPRFVDIRDVARAHVAALTPRPSPGIKHRRIILCGAGGWFSLKQAVDLIATERPELRSRLPNVDAFEEPETVGPVSTARAKEILGIDEFKHWKETILAAVDSFVELEKQWGE